MAKRFFNFYEPRKSGAPRKDDAAPAAPMGGMGGMPGMM